MRSLGSILRLVVPVGLALGLLGCPDTPSNRGDAAPAPASEHVAPPTGRSDADATGAITRANALEHESVWPDIVALVEPWTPPDSDAPLKRGYRGALIRLDDRGRVRIAFGRHGNHDVPIDSTDFLDRANAIRSGERFKPGPTFLVHFGNQFLHPSTTEPTPYPSAELAKYDRFLCVFADPQDARFAMQMKDLAELRDEPRLQILFFPLGMKRGGMEAVKERLRAVSLPVPFAYPEAAEVHARSLLGSVPDRPTAILISAEGRLLEGSGTAPDAPGFVGKVRAALHDPAASTRTAPAS